MPGRRRDGRNLWAAEREDTVAPADGADVDVNPKQRKVLDVQTSAGNAAATAMVQRRAKTADKQFEEMSEFLREPAAAAKQVLEYDAKTGGAGKGGGGGSKSGGSKGGSASTAW